MYCFGWMDFELGSQKRFQYVLQHEEVQASQRICFAYAADIGPTEK